MSEKSPEFSIVVPCFNEADSFPRFYAELFYAMEKMGIAAEFIFVDDGSADETFEKISEQKKTDERIVIFSFPENRGKEAAMLAGISAARGEFVALMDADLQDPPELLPEMFRAVSAEDFDSAGACRIFQGGEDFLRRFFVRIFYKILSGILGAEIPEGARDFRVMRREFADKLVLFPQKFRFTKAIYAVLDGKTKWFLFPNVRRAGGKSKWRFIRLAGYCVHALFYCVRLRFFRFGHNRERY